MKSNEQGLIEAALSSTGRAKMDNLIRHLDKIGFYEASCSGSYHLSRKGGLAEHSLNVYRIMKDMAVVLLSKDEYERLSDSIIICSLLHDVGKCGEYDKPNYIPNMIKDGRPTKDNPEQKYKQSDSKPYITNPELLYIPHEVRSVAIIRQYINLTEEENHAIYYHNGKYTHTGYDLKETPLQMLLHFADLWSSRTIEMEVKTDEDN